MSSILWRAMAALESDPEVIASALASARKQYLTDAELAASLGMAVDDLPRLGLCRRPEPSAPGFRDEVSAIARFAGCDPDRLAVLLCRPTLRENMMADGGGGG